ncbi:MAG: hypothetical protein HUJ63_10520 [Enterococcus sp.]|nr:hypothetical protein [Enterococcus sp.]
MSMGQYSAYHVGIDVESLLSEVLGPECDETRDVLALLRYADVVEGESEFTGEVFPLGDDGVERWSEGRMKEGESVCYVEIPRYPTLFRAPHRSMDGLVKRMVPVYRGFARSANKVLEEEGLESRLPETVGGDVVRRHLSSFIGVYCG